MRAPTLRMPCRLLITAALALVLPGCGGGGDRPGRQDDGPVSYYSASFRQNQSLALMVFDGGLTYGFYMSEFLQPTDFVFAGFFMTTATPSATGVQRSGRDFRFDSREILPVTLEHYRADGATMSATLHGATADDFFMAERAELDQYPTDTQLLRGTYRMQARSPTGGLRGAATVDTAGHLLVDPGDGCRIEATLVGRTFGYLLDVTALFTPGCTLAQGPFSGHALQNPVTGNLYVMLTHAGDNGVLLLFSPDTLPER